MHGFGGLLVLLLRKPAEREEAGAGRAHGVAVGGWKPELAQKLALAPLPAQRGLEEQAPVRALLGVLGQGGGAQTHPRGRQNSVLHLAPVNQQGQADFLGACEHIPEQGRARGAERNPVAVRGIHVLPGSGNRVELGEETLVLRVDVVAADRPAYARGEGIPGEATLDPAAGFGAHEWAREQIDGRGRSGHVAAARVGSRDAHREIERAADP